MYYFACSPVLYKYPYGPCCMPSCDKSESTTFYYFSREGKCRDIDKSCTLGKGNFYNNLIECP